jgi:hypothetical protein
LRSMDAKFKAAGLVGNIARPSSSKVGSWSNCIVKKGAFELGVLIFYQGFYHVLCPDHILLLSLSL